MSGRLLGMALGVERAAQRSFRERVRHVVQHFAIFGNRFVQASLMRPGDARSVMDFRSDGLARITV